MPRPLGWTYRGGEGTTKGGRGLGDVTTNPTNIMSAALQATNSGSSDLNAFNIQDVINELDAPIASVGVTDLGTGGTSASDLVNNLASVATSSSMLPMIMIAAAGVGIILLLKGKR